MSNSFDLNQARHQQTLFEQASLTRYLDWAKTRSHPVQRLLNLTDANSECAHGWLPLDRKRDCTCWPPEAANALAERIQENADYSDAA